MAAIAMMFYFVPFLIQLITTVSGETALRYIVAEEVDVGTVVADVAKDIGISQFSDTQLTFMKKPRLSLALNSQSGSLTTSGRIDREAMCAQKDQCVEELTVVVRRGSGMPPQYIRLFVVVEDINDNAPYFDPSDVTLRVKESESPGYRIVLPSATDKDSTRFGIKQYLLAAPSDTFRLDGEGDGEPALVLLRSLDRERESGISVNVDAVDNGDPSKSGRLYVRIVVDDVNDHHPEFDKDQYETSVLENSALPAPLLRVVATDKDHGENSRIIYSLASKSENEYGKYFLVGNTTGELFLRKALDYEEATEYHLTVVAKDSAAFDPKSATTQIHIRVLDENDNAPQINVLNIDSNSDSSVFEVLEEQERGTFIAFVEVTDQDTGRSGVVDCTLPDRKFMLIKVLNGYNLVTALKLDRERTASMSFDITCADRGEVPKTASRKLEIVVKDINDNVPLFTKAKYTAELMERSFLGAYVLTVTANDSDAGLNAAVEYTLSSTGSAYFNIDPTSGVITLKTEIDRERIAYVPFFVFAKDGAQPSMSGSAQVNVSIIDVNDERPQFLQNSYQFDVEENRPEGITVGEVSAYDTDTAPYNQFTFSLNPIGGAKKAFDINQYTGQITTMRSLNREAQPVYYLNVLAIDKGDSNLVSTASVTIYIGDVNDNGPLFTFPTRENHTIQISPLTRVGSTIMDINALDPDEGNNGTVSYTIGAVSHDGLFSLDPRTGRLSLNVDIRSVGTERVDLQVIARDHGTPPYVSVGNLTVIVNYSLIMTAAEPVEMIFLGLTMDHLKIILLLGIIFLIIVIVLVAAIVCVRRQDRKQRGQKYNCRTEALRHHNGAPLAENAIVDGSTVDRHFMMPLANSSTPEKHLIVTMNRSKSPVSHVLYGSLTPPYDEFLATSGQHHQHQPQHQPEAHHLLGMHHAGEDGDSLEGSNADSGRGTSEDGDIAARLAAAAAEARRGSRDCAIAPVYASVRHGSGAASPQQSLLACQMSAAASSHPIDPRSPTKSRPMTPASAANNRPPSRGGMIDMPVCGPAKRQFSLGDLHVTQPAVSPAASSDCACFHPAQYGDNFVINGQAPTMPRNSFTQYSHSLVPHVLPSNSFHPSTSPHSFVDCQPSRMDANVSMTTMPVYSHTVPSLSTGGPWTRRVPTGRSVTGRPSAVPEEEIAAKPTNSGPIDPKQLCDEIDELFFSKQPGPL